MPGQAFNEEGLEPENALSSVPENEVKGKVIENNEVQGGEVSLDKKELNEIIERNKRLVAGLDQSETVDETTEAMAEKERVIEQFDREKPVVAAGTKNDDDSQPEAQVGTHAKAIYDLKNPEQQIESLIQLAITQDPYYAVKVAKHLDDNYVLNEIHDRLIEDQIREKLLEKGLLQEL